MQKTSRLALFFFLWIIFLLSVGTCGYLILEDGWTFIDALYMVVITITTVGFSEIRELSPLGRIFTAFIIFLGFGSVAMFATYTVRWLLEGELKGLFEQKRIARKIKKMKDHYIICGYGRIGSTICAELLQHGIAFVVIEINEDFAADAEERGFYVLKGNATADEFLKKAGIDHAAGVVAGLTEDADNLYISLAARELNPRIFIVSRGEAPGIENRILRAGADIVVSPIKLGGGQIAELVLQHFKGGGTTACPEAAESVLGYSLQLFRYSGDDIITLGDAKKIAKAIKIVAVKHEDDTYVSLPSEDMEISGHDMVVILAHNQEDSHLTSIATSPEMRRVLLADDHRALRLLFAKKLRSAGYDVMLADSGDEAVLKAEQYEPDVIVLDVMMPGMSGYEACRLIKQKSLLHDVPVILYSANETDEFIKQGMESGASACIRKTSKSSELLMSIDAFFEEHIKAKHAKAEVPQEKPEEELQFNPDQMIEAADGDLDSIQIFIEAFLEETPKQINVIKEALISNEYECMKREAHGIKGAALNLGCEPLAVLLRQLEEAASENIGDDCSRLVTKIDDSFFLLQQQWKDFNWQNAISESAIL